MSDSERIAVLETELKIYKAEISEINAKLDSLLELKNKGAGAFWLASALFGIGFAALLNWIKLW